ncbi:hypothetical protein LF1_53760 [Rubripirellula obstinata]|uniref:Uncharacterized protein n=1 Tax=Rubripirellula obstinata TaxID=406547 RepID=A0A5B1CCJ8_9BACT|nr:hypothetical protein LF1_56260 [Rubripirellula obstinata]KAA1257227.1 hypothetical protein LF1_53760 [Rubripirellula obstinata]
MLTVIRLSRGHLLAVSRSPGHNLRLDWLIAHLLLHFPRFLFCDRSFRSLLWTVLVDSNGCSRRGSPTGRDAGDTPSNPRHDLIRDSEDLYRDSKLVHVATSRRCSLLRRLCSIQRGGVPPMFSARAGHTRFTPMFSTA